jgi:predicted Zn-dependent peptidase
MIKWDKTLLKNGLRIVTVAMPHLHSAEVAVYLKVGGRDDPKGKEGLSHFLEHMLFRGSRDYPTGLALETAFEAIGGAVNAATDAETTCIYSRIHPDHVAKGVALFAAMLRHPLLTELETEQRIVIEEALDDLNEKGEEVDIDTVTSRLLWPEHPLGMPTVGTLESIGSYTVGDLRKHLDRYYRPNNAVLVAVGRIDHARMLQAAQEAFGSWESGEPPAMIPFQGSQSVPLTLFVPDEDSQVDLQLAFRGFPIRDSRLMALRLLRRVLSGGGSSRLHLKLREEMGVVYSVDAVIAAYTETGSFSLDFSTAPDNLVSAVTATLNEVRRIVTEPIAHDELERVRRWYLYELEFGFDSCYDMQVRFGWGEMVGLVWPPEEEQREVLAVESETIQEVARTLFSPENLNLVAVGPISNELEEKVKELVTEYERWYRTELPGR